MNKAIVYVLISLVLMTGVIAASCVTDDDCPSGEVCWADPGFGDDKVCSIDNDSYLIWKWLPGNDGTVNGITVTQVDEHNADWTSTNPGLMAVIVHAGSGQCVSIDYAPGASGTATDEESGLSFIAFCGERGGSNGGNGNGDNPVPEFSFITLAIAVVLAGLGLAYLRKR